MIGYFILKGENMNPYDKARDLAKALKESEEFKAYKEAYDKVMTVEDKKEMVNSYRQKIMNFQIKNMGNSAPDEEELKQLEALQATLFMDDDIKDFMEKEAAFARTYAEIMEILEQAIIIDGKN